MYILHPELISGHGAVESAARNLVSLLRYGHKLLNKATETEDPAPRHVTVQAGIVKGIANNNVISQY